MQGHLNLLFILIKINSDLIVLFLDHVNHILIFPIAHKEIYLKLVILDYRNTFITINYY